MAIVAECSACGKRFKADARLAGRRSKCTACGTVFVIGAISPTSAIAAAATTTAAVSQPAAAVKPPPAAAAAPRPEPKPPLTPVHVEVKPRPPRQISEFDAPVVDTAIATDFQQPPPRRRRHGPVVAIVAILAIVGGAAAALVPKFLASRNSTLASAGENPQPRSGSINGAAMTPAGAVAWSAQPDPSPEFFTPLADFRLPIPALPPLRHDPHSLIVSPPPGHWAAIMLLPDPERPSGPTIEIWDLATRLRTGHFKINQALSGPALSPDGALYAGLVNDPQIHNTRLEVWSVANQTRVQTADMPSRSPDHAEAVLGFTAAVQQVVALGDKLTILDLNTKAPPREIALPLATTPRSQEVRAAGSAHLKLVAVADARSVMLINIETGQTLGAAAIPPAATSHPRQPLSLRAMEFSPDGASLALLFENLQSTRRIAVFDVATGALRSLQTPASPLYAGGPVFQWTPDSRAFLVGSGVLLDRATVRQIGQIYTDLPDEGLGGILATILPVGRALAVWDKYPKSLILRSIPAHREMPGWIDLTITSASASRLEQLQCVSREFGNELPAQSLSQSGRLTDGSHFLIVDAQFVATLAAAAAACPAIVPLRQDQFTLLADGQPRAAIGTINHDDNLTLERPAFDLRKGDATPRRRSIVFPVTGAEHSLVLQIGSAATPIAMPPDAGVQPPPSLAPPLAQRLAEKLFTAPDDPTVVSVKILSARVGPFDLDPEGAGDAPLRVTYSSPAPTEVLAVNFDLAVNLASTAPRGGSRPRVGLMLPDGTTLSPAVTLPAVLPAALVAGEHYTPTCLFVLATRASPLRLTFDNTPVATVTPQRAAPN